MFDSYLPFLQPGGPAILKDLGRDLVARVLEVHDGVRDLQADGNDHRLDVEGTQETVGQDLEMFCN